MGKREDELIRYIESKLRAVSSNLEQAERSRVLIDSAIKRYREDEHNSNQGELL